jgi:hypothetical protein
MYTRVQACTRSFLADSLSLIFLYGSCFCLSEEGWRGCIGRVLLPRVELEG